MKGRRDCTLCGGSGVILDPDPTVPARPCSCARGAAPTVTGISARYQNVTLETFWEWWKSQHPKERILGTMAELCRLLEAPCGSESIPGGLRSQLELTLHKCGARLSAGDLLHKDLKPAWRPEGYEGLVRWARQGVDPVDVWWIDGPPGSGRSSLASAVLRSWCDHTRGTGHFVSARAFSQELKDVYYDTRSFRDLDFLSERDRMTPLLQAGCLVLDDLDRLDPDLRVLRSVAQLLDHRYNEGLPTIVTASNWVEALPPERFALRRLEDPSLLRRLSQAKRVALYPTLLRLHERVEGPGG